MAVTRSRAAERTAIREGQARAGGRGAARELAWLAAAALLVAVGLYRCIRRNRRNWPTPNSRIAARQLLDLNDLGAREDLLPALGFIRQRRKIATEAARARIYYLSGGLPNVGAIRSAVHRRPVPHPQAALRRAPPGAVPPRLPPVDRPVFRGLPGRARLVEPARLARRPDLLPAVLLLTGVGLILMVSLRDPVRDHAAVRRFRAGRGGRLHSAGGPERPRFRALVRQTQLSCRCWPASRFPRC